MPRIIFPRKIWARVLASKFGERHILENKLFWRIYEFSRSWTISASSNRKRFNKKVGEEKCEAEILLEGRTGLDLNSVSVDIGCGENKRGMIGIDVTRLRGVDIVADGHSIPLRNESVGLVTSFWLLEHSFNPLTQLREVFRILKPKGKLVLATDNAAWWRFHVPLPLFYRSWHYGNYSGTSVYDQHYVLFTLENLHNLLKLVGFREIKVYYEYPDSILDRMIRSLPLLRHFGYHGLYAVCMK